MSGPLLTVAGTGGSVAGARSATPRFSGNYPFRDSCHARILSARRVPTKAPSFLIVGADALLAARPATPVQVAHAGAAAGYDGVIPATWGDELIARRVLDRLSEADAPLIHGSCPLVARRLCARSDALAGTLIHFVPPPAATARYLRSLYGARRLYITFAGACPIPSQGDIDEQLSPEAFLEMLAVRGVSLTSQPTEFDSVIPPDRRRHFSEPGGLPSRFALEQAGASVPRSTHGPPPITELTDDDFAAELAQLLLAEGAALVDVSTALGCHCSGATTGVRAADARARVTALEPPRSPGPVVDHDLSVDLEIAVSSPGQESELDDVVASPIVPDSRSLAPHTAEVAAAEEKASESELGTVALDVRRRSPIATPRPVLGSMPLTRTERGAGRHLPRAYVARRRSSPPGLRKSWLRADDSSTATRALRSRWTWIAVIGLVSATLLALLLATGP